MCGIRKLRQARDGLAPSCGTPTGSAIRVGSCTPRPRCEPLPAAASAPAAARRACSGGREAREVPSCRRALPPARAPAIAHHARLFAPAPMVCSAARPATKRKISKERRGERTTQQGDSCWRHSPGLATIYSHSPFPTGQLVEGVSTPTAGALMYLWKPNIPNRPGRVSVSRTGAALPSIARRTSLGELLLALPQYIAAAAASGG